MVSDFYVEPSQATIDSVNRLQEGLPDPEVERNLLAAGWQMPIVNPMHMAGRFPNVERDFTMQYSGFDDCTVENGEVKECQFSLYSIDKKKLTISTKVVKLNSEAGNQFQNDKFQYDVTIKSWELK